MSLVDDDQPPSVGAALERRAREVAAKGLGHEPAEALPLEDQRPLTYAVTVLVPRESADSQRAAAELVTTAVVTKLQAVGKPWKVTATWTNDDGTPGRLST